MFFMFAHIAYASELTIFLGLVAGFARASRAHLAESQEASRLAAAAVPGMAPAVTLSAARGTTRVR
jgi:hypothetical protein